MQRNYTLKDLRIAILEMCYIMNFVEKKTENCITSYRSNSYDVLKSQIRECAKHITPTDDLSKETREIIKIII